MKRIAVISLAIVFLSATWTYAETSTEELGQQIKESQSIELTQKNIELIVAVLASIDWENPEQIDLSVINETIEPCDICDAIAAMFVMAVLAVPAMGLYAPVALLVLYIVLC